MTKRQEKKSISMSKVILQSSAVLLYQMKRYPTFPGLWFYLAQNLFERKRLAKAFVLRELLFNQYLIIKNSFDSINRCQQS